jgi:Tat protein secretion system quality control protein TatD with DNase activity
VTDAHCHPTDIVHPDEKYAAVQLGGLAAMATNDDQAAVKALAEARGWPASSTTSPIPGPKVIACFGESHSASWSANLQLTTGYHPWFVHRFSLGPPPPKEEHYRAVFAPKPSQEALLSEILAHLPEPEDFATHLDRMRANLTSARAAGRLALVGEIGLDASCRVRIQRGADDAFLSPFKTSMAHQHGIARAQLALADELSLPVSWHCVAASGATLELFRDAFPRVRVDIHSLGGMAPEFLRTMAKCCPQAYFSPSLLITARGGAGAPAVRALPRDRMLVESDTHDLARCAGLVWGAVRWIAQCRGWRLEEGEEEWEMEEEDELFDEKGRLREPRDEEVWAVRTLERNWARFMGIVDY